MAISSLVLAKVADMIRKRIKTNRRCADESSSDHEAANTEVMARDLGRFINDMKANKIMDLYLKSNVKGSVKV